MKLKNICPILRCPNTDFEGISYYMAKRFYAAYTDWECYKNGMYGSEVKMDQVEKSKQFLSSTELLNTMRRVSNEWPISTKHNFTNAGSNRRSWIGQAACCINHNATEYETRLAWRELPESICNQANEYADTVIKEWETANNFNKKYYVKDVLRY